MTHTKYHRSKNVLIGLGASVLMLFSVVGCTELAVQPQSASAADIRLPAVIDSNMVIQHGGTVPIWGWAEPGKIIHVTTSWQTSGWGAVADKDGKWIVRINAPKDPGGPYEIDINGKKLKNILCGEVWVCSGQSNMQWSLARSEDPNEAIAAANHPNIRLFYVPRTFAVRPQDDCVADWKQCTPETATGFSAVGYYFSKKLHEELNVPIGIICSSWGGTRIEPWTPRVGFEQVPAISADITKIIDDSEQQYTTNVADSLDTIEAWAADSRKAIKADTLLPEMPAWPVHPLNRHQQPTALYNSMIYPLLPFTVKGAIWYQGESNHREGMLYHEKMKALIAGWRSVWKQKDLPFYYVQLAPYRYMTDPNLPEVWEAQTKTLSVPNTGMAVINDIGDVNDIHPRNKKDVGARLALWALAKDYDRGGLVYSGPLYKTMAPEGNKIRIRFDHVGRGLVSRDDEPLSWFTIAAADKNFVEAQAKIDGDSVLVWSDQIEKPVAVRFAWHELAEPTLMNKEGLPASSFRTDDW